MKRHILSSTALALAVLGTTSADAQAPLTPDSIVGRWCSDTATFNIEPHRLTVTYPKFPDMQTYRIEALEVRGDTVVMKWFSDDRPVHTTFANITATTMVQQALAERDGSQHPPKNFTRCTRAR